MFPMRNQYAFIFAAATFACGSFTIPCRAEVPAHRSDKTAPETAPGTQPSETLSHIGPVREITPEIRRDYELDPFYKKMCSTDGVLIIGSEKVSDFAFLECAWTLDHLLGGRTKALAALTKARVRVGIMAYSEYTMDIPENREMGNGAFNDRRSRGLGGLPLATCAEENLLDLRGDPYIGENITIHEFSHTLASAIAEVDPAWYARLRRAYDQAIAKGLYAKSYAGTDEQEYWAEGAQAWFDAADPGNSGGNAMREQLKQYDPPLAALLTEVYGDGPWRYSKPTSEKRPEKDRRHLLHFDRTEMGTFDFRNSPRIKAATTRPAGDE